MRQPTTRAPSGPLPLALRTYLLGSVTLAVAVALGGAACLPGRNDGPNGSGRVVTDTRSVAGFSTVELRGVGQLQLTLGSQETLTVEAEDNLLPEITTTVNGDTLVLELRRGRPTRPIVYRVTARQITALTTSGAGDIETTALTTSRLRTSQSGAGNIRLGPLTAEALDSSLAGAGSLAVSGTATTLTVSLAGAGRLDARELAVRDAQLTVTGAGNAVVRASDTLRVQISGAGNVEYIGNPRVERQITGVGAVRQIGS